MKNYYVFAVLFILSSCGPDCSNGQDSNAYESGFQEGKTISSFASTTGSYVKSCKEWYDNLGKSQPSECFCAGFDDGLKE